MWITGIGGALRWSPDFEQRSRIKTKFVIHKVSFYLRKHQPWYKDFNNRLEL